MSKGPRVKNWVKWYVRTEALKNRAEPRDSVAERIEEYLEDKEPVPSRDTLNKMISSARNSDDPEDNPWSVSVLVEYEIPPEALPVVMQAWARALEDDKPLTIRQVKWIARLYHVLKDKGVDSLTERASEYAMYEKAIRLTGTYPEKPQDLWWLWFRDSILYLHMTGDDSPLKKCMKTMKWQTTKDIDQLRTKLKTKQKEVTNGTSTTEN